MLSLKISIKDKADFYLRQEIVLFQIVFLAKGNLHTKDQPAQRLAEREQRQGKMARWGCFHRNDGVDSKCCDS